MKAAEQQQQEHNSMDSSESVAVGGEYAYRPLTTKHRRAGSTGTTGDEEYTTDEDELYADETDCAGTNLHPHPILKSDLARAATDLFGYANKRDDQDEEPTSLFDEEDSSKAHQARDADADKAPSPFTYNEEHNYAILSKQQQRNSPTREGSKNLCNSVESKNDVKSHEEESVDQVNRPGDFRIGIESSTDVSVSSVTVVDVPIPEGARESQESHRKSSLPSETRQQIESEVESQARQELCMSRTMFLENDGPPSPTTVQWERAVAEVKGHAVAKLQDELKRAHEELKLKDEEVARLSRIRQDVEAELEELTASLFQEAHNMVREANVRQATAEKLLAESRMKNEVLAAEVAALKTLVLTSTPARPNPHLHPQIDTRGRSGDDGQQQGLFAKKHRRSPSHFNLKYGRENSPPDSPVKEQRASLPSDRDIFERDRERDNTKERDRDRERERDKERDRENRDYGLEVDPRVHTEFLRWKLNPSVDKSDPFVARMFREDIDLCLDFANRELGAKVRQAVLDGIIFIEAISDKSKLAFPKKCALLEAPRQCHYRMRLGDQENQWHCISQICRNRVSSLRSI
ncbi:guanine nucleotide exchange factor for Rab-3A isoform X2 [Cephus cinctus]|uniref:Guanine nucleotide exchange factor for Rab-3A isoform X2 n=1 Tax=Cephus cinctus TaxID=211228 RepID=A0AAJ7RRK7_CEPCN|nr:guanine nucleotide exchange factor for Rab-3A isoform X2 [Cephus cinctus]